MVYHSGYKSFSYLIWGSYSSDYEEDSNQQDLNLISVQVVGFLHINSEKSEGTKQLLICMYCVSQDTDLSPSVLQMSTICCLDTQFLPPKDNCFKEVNAVKSALLYFSGHVIS